MTLYVSLCVYVCCMYGSYVFDGGGRGRGGRTGGVAWRYGCIWLNYDDVLRCDHKLMKHDQLSWGSGNVP